jgi:hypothetical protein
MKLVLENETVFVLIVEDAGLLSVSEICRARVIRVFGTDKFQFYCEEFSPRFGFRIASDEGVTWSREKDEAPFRVACAL